MDRNKRSNANGAETGLDLGEYGYAAAISREVLQREPDDIKGAVGLNSTTVRSTRNIAKQRADQIRGNAMIDRISVLLWHGVAVLLVSDLLLIVINYAFHITVPH